GNATGVSDMDRKGRSRGRAANPAELWDANDRVAGPTAEGRGAARLSVDRIHLFARRAARVADREGLSTGRTALRRCRVRGRCGAPRARRATGAKPGLPRAMAPRRSC